MKKSYAVYKLMDARDAEDNSPSKDPELIEALSIAIGELAEADYEVYRGRWHTQEED